MEALTKQQETLSLRDLEKGFSYTVTNWEHFTSNDNKVKVIITLNDEVKLFLPDRFAKTANPDKIIKDMEKYDLLITYNGLKDVKNKSGFTIQTHDIQFKQIEKHPLDKHFN